MRIFPTEEQKELIEKTFGCCRWYWNQALHDNIEYYDSLDENVLLDGEDKYSADTSAEFITDNDCYLVWFKYD